MKILAKINDNNFILEANSSEINRISGISSSTYNPYCVNQIFNVVDTWRFLTGILEKEDELVKMARNLRSMADMIESVKIQKESFAEPEKIE